MLPLCINQLNDDLYEIICKCNCFSNHKERLWKQLIAKKVLFSQPASEIAKITSLLKCPDCGEVGEWF